MEPDFLWRVIPGPDSENPAWGKNSSPRLLCSSLKPAPQLPVPVMIMACHTHIKTVYLKLDPQVPIFLEDARGNASILEAVEHLDSPLL